MEKNSRRKKFKNIDNYKFGLDIDLIKWNLREIEQNYSEFLETN